MRKLTHANNPYICNIIARCVICFPGPGYGLSFTANIEQYEYTKGSDKGMGIKARKLLFISLALFRPTSFQKPSAVILLPMSVMSRA